MAQHDRRAAADVPVPPLLERLPQQPLDLGARRRAARAGAPRVAATAGFGYTQVQHDRAASARRREADLTPTLRYLQPDDGNADDRTVMEVTTPAPGARRARPCASASTGRRASPTATSAARAGSTTTTSSCSGSPRSACFWKGGLERAPVPPHHRVLLRLRRLRRAADAAARASWWAPPARQERRRATPDGTRDASASSRRTCTTSPGRPAAASSSRRGRFEDAGLSAGRHPAARAARARAPGASATSRRRGSRCAATARGRRPTLRRRSRWWIPPGARPRAAWSTRRSSPAAPACCAPAGAAEPGERDHPRGRPPVLVRPRRQQRVRGGVARRGLQHATTTRRPTTSRSGPRAGAGATSASTRAAARAAAGRWWRPGVWIAARRATTSPRLRAHGRDRRDGAAGLGLPRRATPTASTPTASRRSSLQTLEGLRGRRDHDPHPAHLRAPLPLRAPHERGLHRRRERGDRRRTGAGTSTRRGSPADSCDYAVAVKNERGARGRRASSTGRRRAGARARAGPRRRTSDDARPVRVRGDRAAPGRGAAAGRGAGRVRGRPRRVARRWDGQYRWARFRYPGRAKVVARRRRPRAARSRSTSTPRTTPGWTRTGVARRAAREVGGALAVLAPEPARAAHGARAEPRCRRARATACARCARSWGLACAPARREPRPRARCWPCRSRGALERGPRAPGRRART